MKRLKFAWVGALPGAILGVYIAFSILPTRKGVPMPEFFDWFRPLVAVLSGAAGGGIGAIAGLFVEAFTDQRDK